MSYTDLLTFTFSGPNLYNQNQPIFIDAEDPSQSFTGTQFRRLVRTLIAGFKAHNVQQGDCVLVMLGNSCVARNHSEQICLVDPKAFDYCAQLFLSYEAGYAVSPEVFSAKSEAHPLNFAHLLRHGESDWFTFQDPMAAQTTPAAMFSTSGTSGLPKAAVLSHHNIISQHRSIYNPVDYPVSRLISLPMFHLFGGLWTHIFPVRYGHPLFVLHKFEMTQFLAMVHRFQISEAYLVPAVIHSFLTSKLPVSNYLASLRYVAISGAPIDGATVAAFGNLLQPEAYAGQLWGMTECGIAFQASYNNRADPGSIGRVLDGYEVRLIDNEGNIVQSDDCPGEICVRSAGVFLEYRGRLDGKEAQGWFRTGDIAYAKQGQYFIVGRTKELIKVRGWQVPPAELEAVLLQHPGIIDAAVTGVAVKDGSGEVPRAFVVRSRDPTVGRLSAEEVYKFARARLASYKALDGGVFFVEEIPRTPSGKIQRFKLAKMNTYRQMVTSLLSRFDLERRSSAGHQLSTGLAPGGRVAV
ncbi:hypothetical protein N7470_008723 [Penicillium chermesinum]|nr:hypothetical protein N7470_008723 [Penicillium chermesinum]